jgi:hypothetical protein
MNIWLYRKSTDDALFFVCSKEEIKNKTLFDVFSDNNFHVSLLFKGLMLDIEKDIFVPIKIIVKNDKRLANLIGAIVSNIYEESKRKKLINEIKEVII